MKPFATMFPYARMRLCFRKLLKDNMNSQMGGLLLTSPITSLAELKRERLQVGMFARYPQYYQNFVPT